MRALLPLLLLMACDAADPDRDGLTNAEEADLGTDPKLPDTDFDGLTDAQEARELFTDPLLPDTDEDGYLDGDEIRAHKDPLDPLSVIYQGGWPFQAYKDTLEAPPQGSVLAEGERIPRFFLRDQFGEIVDLYDFAGHGVPVIVELSGMWCQACDEVAAWLRGNPLPIWHRTYQDEDWYDVLPQMVQDGEALWITILDAGELPREPPTEDDQAAWVLAHPNDRVPVLADADRSARRWFSPSFYPDIIVLDDEMVVRRAHDDFDEVFEWLVRR